MATPADANSKEVVRALANLVETLTFGLRRAGEVGRMLLRGRSLAIWERALTEGPPRGPPPLYSAWEWERERPAAKRPCCRLSNGSRSCRADGRVRVGLFPCSAGRPFPRPGLRSGTGVARKGWSRTRVSAPGGLVLDGPERGATLGRSRDAGGFPPPRRRRPPTAPSTGSGSSSALPAPPIKHCDGRALKLREPA